MAYSKYPSTMETTYFAREARVILGPCTDIMRDVLTKNITPSDLSKEVIKLIEQQSKKRTERKKRKKPPFSKDQLQLIHGKNYSDFDITLLYSLLRNVCQITPHINGWGNDPSPNDRSVSANIERIRLKRNKYGHSSKPLITEKEFKKTFQEISQIIQELEEYLETSSTDYHDEVQKIETCSMDPAECAKYIELLDINQRLQNISDAVNLVKAAVVPEHVKKLFKKDVLKWEEDDTVYFETHNFPAMFEQVKNQSYVTFVGAPGTGKSATARHIALKLQNEEGYDILPIKDLNKLEDYCDPDNPQVFVIDDVVGVFGFETEQFNLLKKYKKRIFKPEMLNTKILMTCREVLFKNESLRSSFLVEDMHVIQFQSNQNRLSDDDKRCLLRNYNLDTNLIPSNRMSETSNMFPFLCKMYLNRGLKDFTFFITPIRFIVHQLTEMQKENQIQYASLVLLMMNENKLSEEDFKKEVIENNFTQKKADVLASCELRSTMDIFEFTRALKEMVGTYTQELGPQFCFVHDSLYEIVAYHFGSQCPDLMLKYMRLKYISNYINFGVHGAAKNVNENEEDKAHKDNKQNQTDDVIDLHLTLQESYLPMYAGRLFKEMGNGLFNDVFSALGCPSIHQAFIDIIKEKSYADIKTMFLLEHNLHWRQLDWMMIIHLLELNVWRIWPSPVDLAWLILPKWKIFQRAISLVVCFGYDVILQLIIDKMLISNGNTNDLFYIPCKNGQEGGIVSKHENAENGFTAIKSTKINKTSHGFRRSGLCCVRNTNTDNLDDEYTTAANAKHSDSDNEDIDTSLEPAIVNQWRLLCLGCLSGNFNTFNILLKHVNKAVIDNLSDFGRKLNSDSINLNPLGIAVRYEFLNIARELIKAGAVVNRSILSSTQSMDTIMFLLKAGSNCYINERTEECSRTSFNSVDELLQNCDNVNVYDKLQMMLSPERYDKEFKQNKTPLMIACRNGNLDTAKALLKAGADITSGNEYEHENLVAAACKGGCMDLIEELLKAGAYINPKDIDFFNFRYKSKNQFLKFCEFVQKMKKAGAEVNMNNGLSKLLTYACEHNKPSLVKMLLNEGADVNFEFKNKTPLTSTLEEYTPRRSLDLKFDKDMSGIIEMLLEKKANVNMKTGNTTPLIVACENCKPETVEKLIEAGAIVNLEAGNQTPLIVACKHGKHETLKILIEAGADVDLEAGSITPLIVACECGNINAINELIQAEADVNLKAGDKTPLIVSRNDAIKELIKAGADINLKVGGKTPLMIACKKSTKWNVYEIEELLKGGAKFNLKVGNKSPLMIACQDQYTDIIEEKNINAEFDFNPEAQDNTSQVDVCDETDIHEIDGFEEIETNIYSELRHDSKRMAVCLLGHLYIAKMLYEARGSVTSKGRNNALHTSRCLMGHLRKAEHLIKLGAISNQKEIECYAIKAACRIGDLSLLKELKKNEADINFKDGNETPLMIACENLQIEIVKELIKAKADVNLEVKNETPLTFICQKDAYFNEKELLLGVMEEILKAEADVNKKAGDKTPLIIACKRGYIDKVKLLLKYNANVNLGAGEEMPLICACLNNHLDVVKELLKKGANVNYKNVHTTPLIAAISNFSIRHLQLVKTLVKAGADVNLGNRESKPLDLACKGGHIRLTATLINAGAKVNRKAGKKSLLAVACTEGHIGVIKELIQAGACVNHGYGGKTPLQIAYEKQNMKIVEMLVKAKAICNRKVISPIAVECFVGNTDKVKRLIKDGAALDIIDNTNKTPLTAACQKGNLCLVKELINAGANVNFKDKYNTPLTTACLWGRLDIVKELIKAESDVNLLDVCYTPLTIACFWEENDIVKELISFGADVNLQDKRNTPLIIACLKENLKMVKELIAAKADVNQEAGNDTPLTVACNISGSDIVQVLIDAGADVNLGVKIKTTAPAAGQTTHA